VKGQQGYGILAPVTARFASPNPSDATSWHRLARGEKPQVGKTVRSKLIGLKPTHVWDPLSRDTDLSTRGPSVWLGVSGSRNDGSSACGSSFECFAGSVGELLGSLHCRAYAFDLEFAGGDLPGGFAVLTGFVECAGVAVQHAPEDGQGLFWG
jgi:hypothetical protein